MSRYAREARAAEIKCVSCNAPVTRTVDGSYVCVECGESPVEVHRPAVNGGVRTVVTPGADAGDAADPALDPVISVVLPTMNEEAAVGECVRAAREAIADIGVPGEIIVSDSSTDRTPEIAREAGATVVEPDRPGYGSAYLYAFEFARGDYVVIGDADLTYDFAELPELFEPVASGEADVVLGSRFDGEIRDGAMPALHRYVGNPLLTRVLNLFYDAGVTDAHSGFRVVRREALDEMVLRTDGMEFASEMLMEASARGFAIEERPITYHEREGEATLDSFRDGWRHVRFMLLNVPGYVFSVPALVFGVLGLLVLAASLTWFPAWSAAGRSHVAIAGAVVTVVGYQVGSLAVFSGLAVDSIRKPRDPITAWIRENFRLEHGMVAGLLLLLAGGAYLAYAGLGIVARGRPVVPTDVVAFTAALLGIQTVFYSLFFSMVGKRWS